MRLGVLLSLASLAFATMACDAAPERTTSSDDALSTADFDTTVQELTALPWLPWAYTADGCYARAEYYSMLLASRGVPTNHLYVLARAGTTLGGQWSWHVAPLVTKDGDTNHLYVLDPVYDTTRALTNVEWVARQGFRDPSAADYPFLHVLPGNSYLDENLPSLPLANPANPDAARYKEPTFTAMPSFDVRNVMKACKVMHSYIDLEPGTSSAQKTEKHASLGRQTKALVHALAEKRKLEGEATALYRNCTQDPADPTEPSDGWGGWGN